MPVAGQCDRDDSTTQNGEEQVLRKILRKLPAPVGWCVEFGAWDGKYLSNSYSFIADDRWNAVLIEGNGAYYAGLLDTWSHDDRVTTLHRMVGWSGADALDEILRGTSIPTEFDFLSIDIDGNDYHVWDALEHHRPRVVVIEFNHTVPNSVDFVQPRDPDVNQGSSVLALRRLGRSKNYDLVDTTRFNAFFVDRRYSNAWGSVDAELATLRPEAGSVTYIFSGYDGTVFLEGMQRLPWHNLSMHRRRVQRLPRFLRTYPLNYRRSQLALYYVYRARDIISRAGSRQEARDLLRSKLAVAFRGLTRRDG